MLVVISSPAPMAHEAGLINALFDEGLEIFHVRKPGIKTNAMKKLIEKVKPQYRSLIALHQHHELAATLGIRRLHFTETARKETDEKQLSGLKSSNFVLSTSIHHMDVHGKLDSAFDYTFFGPVFNSISKKGYDSKLSGDFTFQSGAHHPKVVGIGGMDISNFQKALEMGFDGVAFLGAIWEWPGKSIENFKLIRAAWKHPDQSF